MAVQVTEQERVTLVPILDHIIVEKAEQERQVGRIAIPESVSDFRLGKAERATVVAVGPGRIGRKGALQRPEVEVGMQVFIKRAMGTACKDGGGRVLVFVEPDDVLAVVA